MAVPKFYDMYDALLKALHELGGSASITEQEEKVGEILKLSDKDINEILPNHRTKLAYTLAWTRNYLKRYGLLENSAREVWSLTKKGYSTTHVEKADVEKSVKRLDVKAKSDQAIDTVKESVTKELGWENEMLDIIKKIDPGDFERLCQRILRESGFIQVNVTGRSGDGGIDGTGIIQMSGFVSFRVIFQCKRYQGTISSAEIREFKGTMSGRSDKGLFITTGTFSRDAKQEAIRNSATSIDLIDGIALVQKMKELRIGVKVKTQELVEVDHDWFESFK